MTLIIILALIYLVAFALHKQETERLLRVKQTKRLRGEVTGHGKNVPFSKVKPN